MKGKGGEGMGRGWNRREERGEVLKGKGRERMRSEREGMRREGEGRDEESRVTTREIGRTNFEQREDLKRYNILPINSTI